MRKVSDDLRFLLRSNWRDTDVRGELLKVLTHRWYDGFREEDDFDFDDDASGYIDILRDELKSLHKVGYIGEAFLKFVDDIVTDPGRKVMSFHDDLVGLMETKLGKNHDV